MKPDEVRDYLSFRLRTAGYRGPDIFSPPVVNTIARSSAGLTRRINLIADKAMLAAFAENTHTIKIKHVKAAVRDSEFSHYERPRPWLTLGFGVSLFAVGAGLGIVFYSFVAVYRSDASLPVRPVANETPQPAGNPQLPGALSQPTSSAPASVAIPQQTTNLPSASDPVSPTPINLKTVFDCVQTAGDSGRLWFSMYRRESPDG